MVDINPESKTNRGLSILLYIFVMYYFIIFGIFLYKKYFFTSLIFWFFACTLILLFVCNSLANLGYKKYCTFFQKCYVKVILFIAGWLSKSHGQKISFKSQLKKLVYIMLHFYLPIIFITFTIVQGHWQLEQNEGEITDYSNETLNHHRQLERGTIKIIPNTNSEYQIKLTYVLGNILNIPVLDLCFINNGTTDLVHTINNTFQSTVIINNDTRSVPYFSEYCHQIESKHNTYNYFWKTEYDVSVLSDSETNSRTYLSTEPNNSIIVTLNENFILMTAIFVFAWIGVIHLLYRVIRDLDEIN